jgi:hypothetical protein
MAQSINPADAEAAAFILGVEEVVLTLAVIVAPVLLEDVRRLRRGDPSISNVLGYPFERYPKISWSIWLGLGAHFGLRLSGDPLGKLGGWIRGLRG